MFRHNTLTSPRYPASSYNTQYNETTSNLAHPIKLWCCWYSHKRKPKKPHQTVIWLVRSPSSSTPYTILIGNEHRMNRRLLLKHVKARTKSNARRYYVSFYFFCQYTEIHPCTFQKSIITHHITHHALTRLIVPFNFCIYNPKVGITTAAKQYQQHEHFFLCFVVPFWCRY